MSATQGYQDRTHKHHVSVCVSVHTCARTIPMAIIIRLNICTRPLQATKILGNDNLLHADEAIKA